MAAVSDGGSKSVSRFQFETLNSICPVTLFSTGRGYSWCHQNAQQYNNAACSNGDNLGENRWRYGRWYLIKMREKENNYIAR
jgi:hypothetical protein